MALKFNANTVWSTEVVEEHWSRTFLSPNLGTNVKNKKRSGSTGTENASSKSKSFERS